MYAMKPADRRELAEYRALGTVEELRGSRNEGEGK